ncbi:MAG: quinolinate synthase NadA [Methanocellales archaeon]|nr:quinolinate synthase NadA [Methanocellales archaeon]
MLQDRIKELKEERNAIILAHNYQIGEVQDIADYKGDSLGLSQKAAKSDADVIVFCGVDFMAESAAILCSDKMVLLPELSAKCPMAAMITAESLRAEKEKYPDAVVVCYVNTTAEVKAESDICCTSSNAIKVVNSLKEDEIIFVPDKNLALYVAAHTDKTIIPWEGYCPSHHFILKGEVLLAKARRPEAEILVHPECRQEVIEIADKAFSTDGMIRYAKRSKAKEFIIGTETGILYRLRRENPDKRFYPASDRAICPSMKVNTLDKIVNALENMEHKITIPEDIRVRAKQALDRMLEVGRGD